MSMDSIPPALKEFVSRNNLSEVSRAGREQSIFFAVRWHSSRFNLLYVVSTGDKSVEVSSIVEPDNWIGISTLKSYLEHADPTAIIGLLSLEEEIQYLSNHVDEIAEALAPENIDKVVRFEGVNADAFFGGIRRGEYMLPTLGVGPSWLTRIMMWLSDAFFKRTK